MSVKGNAANEVSEGEVLGGRYRVQEQLGVGGMGAVFRAVDLTTNKDVAVKILHDTEGGSVQAQRLIREAKVCMAIEHPSVVRVYSLEEREKRALYIVMEYLPGVTVSHHLKTRGAFAPSDAANITLSLLSALSSIHGLGFFHRDVKGSNVLLVNGDPTKTKLLDLGIAKAADVGTSLTAEGMWVGTLTAMAPELFEGLRFDVRSEIFSVGLLLYVMLEASAPFPRDHLPTRLKAMAAGPRLPAKRMSRALWNVISRALSAQPAKRYQTAMAMHDALTEAMLDRDIVIIDPGDGAPTDLMPPIQMPPPGHHGRDGSADFSIDDTAKDRDPAVSFRSHSNRAPSLAMQSQDVLTQRALPGSRPSSADAASSVTVRVSLPHAPAPHPGAQTHGPNAPAPRNPLAQTPAPGSQPLPPSSLSPHTGRAASRVDDATTVGRHSISMSRGSSSSKQIMFVGLGVLAGLIVSSTIVFLVWNYLL